MACNKFSYNLFHIHNSSNLLVLTVGVPAYIAINYSTSKGAAARKHEVEKIPKAKSIFIINHKSN